MNKNEKLYNYLAEGTNYFQNVYCGIKEKEKIKKLHDKYTFDENIEKLVSRFCSIDSYSAYFYNDEEENCFKKLKLLLEAVIKEETIKNSTKKQRDNKCRTGALKTSFKRKFCLFTADDQIKDLATSEFLQMYCDGYILVAVCKDDAIPLDDYKTGDNIEYPDMRTVFRKCENYDIDEHFSMWYGANRGEPSSPQDLLDDCEEIEKMLYKLSEAVKAVC